MLLFILHTVIANQCAHWCGNLLFEMGIPTSPTAPRNDY